VRLDPQSPDISQGVTAGAGLHRDQGAGDQGMMFGYACRETDTLMPAPIYWAHRLTERLAEVRKRGIVDYFYPDGKSQVTLAYENGQPVHADTVVIAQQHAEDVEHAKIVEDVREHVIEAVLPPELLDPLPELHINATGRFVIGGPHGDCGLTGRKIIVDTYGGYAPHGGGAFSGKDPSKVDRSAAYAARWVAKNVVAAGMADRCQIALAYSIGVADPLWVDIKTFGTGNATKIRKAIDRQFDLRPRAIIEDLDLLRPIYTPTAAYGHFGRELPDFTWEKTGVL
jgi:S-adenosylmethionine synthetase